ncbi:MAG: 8-oxo-dGTP diphosphatase [Chthoniobacteraceae bacterium]|nr:8-oxo-dGTP diphosphatase [Chthoniobacteraceae bacterium]
MNALSEIDWTTWTPRERAVLCFIFRPGEVLLILKKRGLGGGKINAPGGKIEPGETPGEAAIRETREEVGLTPHAPRPLGELFFQFTDGLGIHCVVFRAEGCEGVLCETDEADPRWTPLDAIPYEAMWADDALWMPHLLAGRAFRGRFLFDGETMLDRCLEVLPPGAFQAGGEA